MGRKKMMEKKRTMSESKRKRLEHYVFNIMSRKDKGRSKKPAMTKKWGKVVKPKWKSKMIVVNQSIIESIMIANQHRNVSKKQ